MKCAQIDPSLRVGIESLEIANYPFLPAIEAGQKMLHFSPS